MSKIVEREVAFIGYSFCNAPFHYPVKCEHSLRHLGSIGENFLVNNCGIFVLKILSRMHFLSHFQNES